MAEMEERKVKTGATLWGQRMTLLCILLFVAFYPGTSALETNKFQGEIDAFVKQDQTNPPPKEGILFAGSSSFRMWKTLAQDFPEHRMVNRGFGGSQMSDLNFFIGKIVLPYAPRQIFVYEGDNDVAAGKSPETILNDFKEFVRMVKKELPRATIHFVSIKPSPSRWHLVDKTRKANELIKALAEEDPQVEYVDVFTPMLAADGKPDPSLFVSDNLHLNEKGYALWKQVIRPHLKK